jgi:ABC-type transport system substrate-binding protein
VRFYAKDVYFRNFSSVASGILTIVPRHIYENPADGDNLNRTLVGTGPYVIDRYERGRRLVLAKNPLWWGNTSPDRVGEYNFERIIIRFVKEENIAIEMLQKTELDYLGLRPEDYVQKTTGPQWGRDVFKVKAENLAPKGYGFLGFNLENPLFSDRRVRVALSHLMNREAMNEQFRFGMSLLASGPWYQQSRFADPAVKPLGFNVERAIELLREAGWEDAQNQGVLEKTVDGQRREFRFTLLLPNQDMEKYFTLYREDLKKAGVHMNIRIIEWNSFIKLLDERNFEAVTLAWSAGSADIDPKQVWHSDSRKGGSNFVGYNNAEVDSLIDQARRTLDDTDREPLLRRVYRIIAEDAPYVFLFNDQYILYGHSKNISKEVDTFPYDIGTSRWKPVSAQ